MVDAIYRQIILLIGIKKHLSNFDLWWDVFEHNEANGAYVTYLDIDIPMHLLMYCNWRDTDAQKCVLGVHFLWFTGQNTSNRDKHVNLRLAFIFLLFAHERKELFFFVPRIIHRYLYKILYLIYQI